MEDIDEFTTQIVKEIGFPKKLQEDIVMSLLQAISHAIEHCNIDTEGEIHIQYDLQPGKMTVWVRDSGDAFDRRKIQENKCATQAATNSFKAIYVIEELMDEVEYYNAAYGTMVKMVKHKPHGKSSAK